MEVPQPLNLSVVYPLMNGGDSIGGSGERYDPYKEYKYIVEEGTATGMVYSFTIFYRGLVQSTYTDADY